MTQRIWWHICIFFNAQTNLKNPKEPPSKRTKTTVNMDRHSDIGQESTTGNSTYKKLAVQWLNEALFFVSSFVVAESLVLRNRQLLVAAKRWRQAVVTSETS